MRPMGSKLLGYEPIAKRIETLVQDRSKETLGWLTSVCDALRHQVPNGIFPCLAGSSLQNANTPIAVLVAALLQESLKVLSPFPPVFNA